MAREALNWRELDPKIRHYARCGFSIRRQASKLSISEISIKKRRAFLGIAKKKHAAQENSSHVAS
ncbi:hypothetical protein [Acetobacter pasteurianus]|uniref:Uncharacterized protein n=1 Tax=Acetobacter pasteurianus subsp. pasteurianus TaxID=481145 RepID=A0AAC9SRX1_ACEPA|nr:hypothetical protein [Acetobacter pasteurianus]ASC05012.1 hypothetical protein S101468_00745 [Acetobacter pasteurianus subsp. pasteurianus]